MKTAPAVRTPFLLSLLMALLAALPCAAQTNDQHPDIIFPQIKMDDVSMADAIVHLARQAQMNLIVDNRLIADSNIPPVTITFTNITAKEALDRILKIRRLVRIENLATTVSRIVPANLGIKPLNPELLKNDTNEIVPQITMEEVPLRDALRLLAKQAGVNVSIDDKLPAVRSTYVSLRWTKLTVKQALIALLDNYDLTLIENPSDGTATIIGKKSPPKTP